MKILHLSNYYFPHIGGVEQTARDAVNSLKDGNEQEVFCFNHEKGNGIDETDGVKIVRAGCFAKISSQSLSFSYGKLLKKEFKNFKPDTVVFHFPNPFAAHYLLKILKKFKKQNNCKLVVYYHLDITKQKILGKLFKGQTMRLLAAADKIISTSPDYVEGSPFLKQFANKCAVVPSCVNEERLAVSEKSIAKANEVRAENEGKIILFAVGRHVEYKGMKYLVRAGKLLGGGYKIYIGGEGPLTEELKKEAAGDENIEFLGKMGEDDLKAYFAACDIFCFPSITKNEAFGLSLAEAMYFGKPAVTFKIEGSGVNFVNLNGVTGLEAENSSAEDFARAVQTLGGDAALRKKLGEAARERVLNLFTFRDYSQNILKEINSLNGKTEL